MKNDLDSFKLAQQIARGEEAQVLTDASPSSSENAAAERGVPAEMPAHPDLQTRAITKEPKTAEQLAEMILSDLKRVNGCPKAGVTVTVYGLDPWNCWLHFGAAAGPVRNKQELQEYCTILTDRLKIRYDILH